MSAEGAVGLWQGLAAGSAALTGVGAGQRGGGPGQRGRGLAIHRRPDLSETAEPRAPAVRGGSFWLLAPYIAAESAWEVASRDHAEATAAGIALTAVAVVVMPLLGRAKRRLGSAATAGEGTQN